jgi:hypothetical protein
MWPSRIQATAMKNTHRHVLASAVALCAADAGAACLCDAQVDVAFGARALFEADMLVRISDEAINRAKTPEDVLNAIDQGIPFIERPDRVVQAPPRPGLELEVTYEGLPDTPKVKVSLK